MTPGTQEAQLVTVEAKDGARIALWKSGTGPSLLAVHGTAADHTAGEAMIPLMAADLSQRRQPGTLRGRPTPTGLRLAPGEFIAHLEQLVSAGQREEALSAVMTRTAGLTPEELPTQAAASLRPADAAMPIAAAMASR